MKTNIFISFSIPGFHCWKNAPKRYSYLTKIHRHVFCWEIEIPVTHNNRDIEFIDLKDLLVSRILIKWNLDEFENEFNLNTHLFFNSMSCEMIAKETIVLLELENIDCYSVKVTEDNENGAVIRA